MDSWLIKKPVAQKPESSSITEAQPSEAQPIEAQPMAGPSSAPSQPWPELKKTKDTCKSNTQPTSRSEMSVSSESDFEEQEEPMEPCEKKCKGKKRVQTNYKKAQKFSNNWLTHPSFKDWVTKITKGDKEMAFCKICQKEIFAHKGSLVRHSKSEKHIFNTQKICSNKKIEDYTSKAASTNIKIAELNLCGLLAANNLSFKLMDSLTLVLKKIFPDSQIAQGLRLHRTKATAVVVESLGKNFFEEVNEKLRVPGCFFSLIMDETTDISIKKQCAVTVIFFDITNNKVITQFFDLIESEGSAAIELFEAMMSTLKNKNIPLTNFVGFSSDTTNVMAGKFHSVFSLLKEKNPSIICVKCSCHMAHLATSKACLKLPKSVEDLLRNIGGHFHRSSQRTKKFEEFQAFFRVDIHKILSPSITRWLSIKNCVDRVLEQYEPLKAYFRELLFEDPSHTTQLMTEAMENKFTKIYLEFMRYTLGLMTDFNTLFQSEKPLLYRVKPETTNLIKTLCSNYMDVSVVRKSDIFQLDHKNPRNFVALENIYLGLEATETISKLAENPAIKKEIGQFYKTVLEFYIELVTQIKERFTFEDEVFQYVEIVDPLVAQSFQEKSLQKILHRFPILKSYIKDSQSLDNEWRQHALLNFEELQIPVDDPERYWAEIFKLKNSAGIEIFQNLKVVISLLLVLPFSNASVERVFSDVFNIKTDKRNLLNTDTLRALLATKEGIEQQGGCLQFKPSQKMLNANIWK